MLSPKKRLWFQGGWVVTPPRKGLAQVAHEGGAELYSGYVREAFGDNRTGVIT
jgi:hypothetical protein